MPPFAHNAVFGFWNFSGRWVFLLIPGGGGGGCHFSIKRFEINCSALGQRIFVRLGAFLRAPLCGFGIDFLKGPPCIFNFPPPRTIICAELEVKKKKRERQKDRICYRINSSSCTHGYWECRARVVLKRKVFPAGCLLSFNVSGM